MTRADCRPVEKGLHWRSGARKDRWDRRMAVGKERPRQIADRARGKGGGAGKGGGIIQEGRAAGDEAAHIGAGIGCVRSRGRPWRRRRRPRCAPSAARRRCRRSAHRAHAQCPECCRGYRPPMTETWARLSSGWRNGARARLMILKASSSTALTSVALSAVPTSAASVPAMAG